MRGYLREIKNAVRKEPTRLVRVSCRDCGISFLTSKVNEGRDDMRCHTGCWDSHDREDSKRRTAEYYGTKEGRDKKKTLNARRSQITAGKSPPGTKEVKATKVSALLRYYGWLIKILDGIALDVAAIAELRWSVQQRVRQQSRDIRNEVRDNRDD